MALTVYLIGVGVVSLRLLSSIRGLRRLLRGAERLDGERWRALLGTAAVRKSATDRIELATASVPVPMTWGWRRPVVLLPREAASWSRERCLQALRHELSHIERSDWIVQVLARAVCAFYWFHPLAWVAYRGLRLEAERASDDRVLLSGAPSGDYAEQLLDLARRLRDPGVRFADAVLTMSRRAQLSIRIEAILNDKIRSPP